MVSLKWKIMSCTRREAVWVALAIFIFAHDVIEGCMMRSSARAPLLQSRLLGNIATAIISFGGSVFCRKRIHLLRFSVCKSNGFQSTILALSPVATMGKTIGGGSAERKGPLRNSFWRYSKMLSNSTANLKLKMKKKCVPKRKEAHNFSQIRRTPFHRAAGNYSRTSSQRPPWRQKDVAVVERWWLSRGRQRCDMTPVFLKGAATSKQNCSFLAYQYETQQKQRLDKNRDERRAVRIKFGDHLKQTMGICIHRSSVVD